MSSLKTVKRGGFKFSFNNEEEFLRIYEDIFIRREWSFKANSDSPFIIDCGSHIGMSILYFKNLYPKARILAFEPNPETFKILRLNVRQNNLEDVRCVNAALSDKKGTINFYVSKGAKKGKEETWAWGESAIFRIPKVRRAITVQAVKLSLFINQKVDLIKLDIEGLEERVLEEISLKLQLIDQIMIEFHGLGKNKERELMDMIAILEENSFRCRFNQDWEFIKKSQLKLKMPFWLTIYAKKRKVS